MQPACEDDARDFVSCKDITALQLFVSEQFSTQLLHGYGVYLSKFAEDHKFNCQLREI